MKDQYLDLFIRNLSLEIIRVAAADYRTALQGRGITNGRVYVSPEALREECEAFFTSDYYAAMSPWDGQWMMDNLRRMVTGA